jgi:hypothetical protein
MDPTDSISYFGFIDSPRDAYLVIEACKRGLLSSVNRRLNDHERKTLIYSGAVFVWDEEASGMVRWTDGRYWLPSRVRGSFLVYQEIKDKRVKALENRSDKSSIVTGLVKKSISFTFPSKQKRHLVSYFRPEDIPHLKTPSKDPFFSSIEVNDVDLLLIDVTGTPKEPRMSSSSLTTIKDVDIQKKSQIVTTRPQKNTYQLPKLESSMSQIRQTRSITLPDNYNSETQPVFFAHRNWIPLLSDPTLLLNRQFLKTQIRWDKRTPDSFQNVIR